MAATTGMLISGYMSVGIRKIVITPIRTMSIASTTKVYGLRRARRTIHTGDAPGTFRTCTREWVHAFSFTARANRDSENQACIPLAHRPSDRFPTGDLIAHCTVHFPCGRLVNEGARPRHGDSLFQNCKSTGPERSPGPVERLGFGD